MDDYVEGSWWEAEQREAPNEEAELAQERAAFQPLLDRVLDLMCPAIPVQG